MTSDRVQGPERHILGFGLIILLVANLGLGSGLAGSLYFSVAAGTGGLISAVVCLSVVAITAGYLRVIDPAVYGFLGAGLAAFSVSLMLSDAGASLNGALVSLAMAALPMGLFLLASNRGALQGGKEFFYWFFLVYGTWLALQTVAVAARMLSQTGRIPKAEIATAVGKSNFVASHLLICLLLVTLWPSAVQAWIKWSSAALIATALLLTSSFGALVVLVVVALMATVLKGESRRVMFGTVALLGGLSVMYLAAWLLGLAGQVSEAVTISFDRFDKKLGYWSAGDIGALGAGRSDLFELAVEQIEAAPWFGSASFIDVAGQATRAHNWILDALVARGFVGLCTFVGAVAAVLAVTRGAARDDWWVKVALLALVAGLLHGLLEPNFFSRTFDFLWWMLAGAAVGVSASAKEEPRLQDRAVLEEVSS